jgi:hypothetical protein
MACECAVAQIRRICSVFAPILHAEHSGYVSVTMDRCHTK